MTINVTRTWPLGLLLASCATGGLPSLAVDGHELHATLELRPLHEDATRHVRPAVVDANPKVSSDPAFVQAIARSGSQGQLDGDGMTAALFAIYRQPTDLGIYGLEAGTVAGAEERELTLRSIWAHNIGLERARVHRSGRIVLVVWHDGVPAECWERANASLVARLSGL